ncbi:MAG: DUF2085 domain-containing protein [Candidatus Kryptonium sp.]|nr:DUF2085 domain-containing protein [Candidatus Kryptonium sp.]MCX7762527.1 DUF2085 domain-containing protein [Candidatus Kryptonium sp.]MDW8108229.1 DUF2085 domain-containing protein [Candidatus Kryptonium sp.]
MSKAERKIYVVVLFIVVLFNFLVVSPVIFENVGLGGFSGLAYRFFSPICHQNEFGSFHINGIKLAACSRCSLIYLGALVGVLIFPFLKRKDLLERSNFLLVLALMPSAIEFSLEKFLDVNFGSVKVLVSLWLGGVAGAVLTSQFVDMFSSRKS